MAMIDCPDLAVPKEVMQHVVRVESSRNPFAIGVVGGYLARQPTNLEEALATVRQLKEEGYNFSVGISQVNRYNLAKYGLTTYAEAFDVCANLKAGSRILRECYDRAQDWGKAFSCYYSGNFSTGFEHGYVQKIFASIRKAQLSLTEKQDAIRVIPYGNKSRKPAKQDGVPLKLFSSAEVTQFHIGSEYPEPYAIRKFLPATSLAATADAIRASAAHRAKQEVETAEGRSAIPVPGPGAVDRSIGSVSAQALSAIPTQLVGVGGDPYQTRLIQPMTAPREAHDLPMPNLDALLVSREEPKSNTLKSSESTSVVAKKGGALLHSTVSSGGPEKPAKGREPVAESTQRGEASSSADASFVF